MASTQRTEVGEENRRRGGGVFNFILCIALLVSSSIYLHNLNSAIDTTKPIYLTDCVPNILPPNLISDCGYLKLWKSFAILAIVRSVFYVLQIVGIFSSYYFRPEVNKSIDAKSAPRCSFIITLVTLAISLVLTIIPIYLAINLVRTSAIYSTLSSLSQPAMVMFVICLTELIGILLQWLCLSCVILGTAITGGCLFCCVYCQKHDGTTVRAPVDGVQEETKAMTLQKVTVAK